MGDDRWCLVELPESLSCNVKGRDIADTPHSRGGDLHSYGGSSGQTPNQRPRVQRRGTARVMKAPDLLTGVEAKTWVEAAENSWSELNERRWVRTVRRTDMRTDSAANRTPSGSRDAFEVRMHPLSPATARRATVVNHGEKRKASVRIG